MNEQIYNKLKNKCKCGHSEKDHFHPASGVWLCMETNWSTVPGNSGVGTVCGCTWFEPISLLEICEKIEEQYE